MCQAVLLFCSLSAICLLDTAHLQHQEKPEMVMAPNYLRLG